MKKNSFTAFPTVNSTSRSEDPSPAIVVINNLAILPRRLRDEISNATVTIVAKRGNGVLVPGRNLLEQIGKRLPKDEGKKGIPLVGAILGAGFDSYLMNRVLKGEE